MRPINKYISNKIKASDIKATDETIKKIVKDELDRLGHDADLNHIDVSKVTNMGNLFSCHKDVLGRKYKDLNPDISRWNVSNVENMCYMFYECEKFNCDIFKWDVRNVTNMDSMFCGCKKFNQNISGWDVWKVENMWGMFENCKNFDQYLSGWDVSKVKYMDYMFIGCKKFDQDLSGWDVNKVKSHDFMFNDCPIKEEFKPKFRV